MGASVNSVALLGGVTKEIGLIRINNGSAVAEILLATSNKFKDKSGVWQETTEYHSINCWNGIAENAAKYLKKGSQIFVEGSLKTRSWDGDDGKKRYKTEVIAQRIQYLSGFKSKEEAEGGQQAPQPQQQAPQGKQPIDDDLPF